MRISDWSSDVCSSDLVDEDRLGLTGQSYGGLETAFIITQTDIFKAAVAVDLDSDLLAAALQTYGHYDGPPASMSSALAQTNQFYMTRAPWDDPERSEEHTSELQSLMRISYAVFCLKKKKHNHKQ